jgi:hypothetical protein
MSLPSSSSSSSTSSSPLFPSFLSSSSTSFSSSSRRVLFLLVLANLFFLFFYLHFSLSSSPSSSSSFPFSFSTTRIDVELESRWTSTKLRMRKDSPSSSSSSPTKKTSKQRWAVLFPSQRILETLNSSYFIPHFIPSSFSSPSSAPTWKVVIVVDLITEECKTRFFASSSLQSSIHLIDLASLSSSSAPTPSFFSYFSFLPSASAPHLRSLSLLDDEPQNVKRRLGFLYAIWQGANLILNLENGEVEADGGGVGTERSSLFFTSSPYIIPHPMGIDPIYSDMFKPGKVSSHCLHTRIHTPIPFSLFSRSLSLSYSHLLPLIHPFSHISPDFTSFANLISSPALCGSIFYTQEDRGHALDSPFRFALSTI